MEIDSHSRKVVVEIGEVLRLNIERMVGTQVRRRTGTYEMILNLFLANLDVQIP